MKNYFNITYFLALGRADQSGMAPVYIRSKQNSCKQIMYSLGFKVHPMQWDKKKNEPKHKPDALIDFETRLKEIYEELIEKMGMEPTLNDLIVHLNDPRKVPGKNVIDLKPNVQNAYVMSKTNWYNTPKRKAQLPSSIRKGYIYIAEDHAIPGCLKIGFSIKPQVREATLQAQKPTINFIRVERGTTKHERMLHEHFKDRRVRGEWFRISVEEAEEALLKIVSTSKVVTTSL